jgi:hypothetical protein
MNMKISINNKTSDTTAWKFESKLQNDKTTSYSAKKRKENILYPMFYIIDEMLINFIEKFPYKIKSKK